MILKIRRFFKDLGVNADALVMELYLSPVFGYFDIADKLCG
jgi:hypothetical protein